MRMVSQIKNPCHIRPRRYSTTRIISNLS